MILEGEKYQLSNVPPWFSVHIPGYVPPIPNMTKSQAFVLKHEYKVYNPLGNTAQHSLWKI